MYDDKKDEVEITLSPAPDSQFQGSRQFQQQSPDAQYPDSRQGQQQYPGAQYPDSQQHSQYLAPYRQYQPYQQSRSNQSFQQNRQYQQGQPYPQQLQYQQSKQYSQNAAYQIYQQSPARSHAGTRQQHNSGSGKVALLIVLCMVLAAAAGFAGGYIAQTNRPSTTIADTYPGISNPTPSNPVESLPPVFEGSASPSDIFASSNLANNKEQDLTAPEVAAIVKQSVVEIKTEIVTSGGWSGSYISEGAGSGIIISEDGYIITNDHVISGASSITVRLVDGREFPASLIATDSRADIAVIKIAASGLSAAVFGDSSTLVVGESALAVGNPLGELGGTVTGGIISALDREMIVEGEAMTLLQTDAAVNPGNSGGGLFNMRAELIGVVNSKSSGLNIEGLGFAIPSNIAKAVAADLIAYGYVRGRTDAGLELVDIQTSQAARWYRVSQVGLYILNSVDEQLRNGDRITAVNDIPVANLSDFNEATKDSGIGDTIRITVARNNETITASITLREWKP